MTAEIPRYSHQGSSLSSLGTVLYNLSVHVRFGTLTEWHSLRLHWNAQIDLVAWPSRVNCLFAYAPYGEGPVPAGRGKRRGRRRREARRPKGGRDPVVGPAVIARRVPPGVVALGRADQVRASASMVLRYASMNAAYNARRLSRPALLIGSPAYVPWPHGYCSSKRAHTRSTQLETRIHLFQGGSEPSVG